MQIINEIIEAARIEAENKFKNQNHTATAKTAEIIKVLAKRVERAETDRDNWRKSAEKWQTVKK